MPRLTIGVPAYKNAPTLRTSVESLLAQSFGDFKLVISDDNSPDDTQEIAMQLAREDSRVEYLRQPKNLKYQNFGYLLRRANTEFFMWAAGDDRWLPDFARCCIGELDVNPAIVLATPRVAFEQAGEVIRLSDGTYPLLDNIKENIRRYLLSPGDNSRMYGVFRTDVGQQSFPVTSFHAYDYAFCAATLRFGGHAEIPEVLMMRDRTPPNYYDILARADGRNPLTRAFPMLEMSRWLLAEAKIPCTKSILRTLLVANVNKHISYMENFYPRYTRALQPLTNLWRRQFEWRLVN